MNEIITNIILAILPVVLSILVPATMKLIRRTEEKISNTVGHDNFNAAVQFGKVIVNAIEQKYPAIANEDKYIKAVEMIVERFGSRTFTNSEIEVIIENAVKEIKKNLNQAT